MSLLQYDVGRYASPDLALNAATLTPTGVALQSVSDLLERWHDELTRFEFKLKEKPDPLLHLAELTVLPCAYACYKASNALVHGAQELAALRCPLGVSSREPGRYSFRYHTRGEIRKKQLPDFTINLREEILDVMREVRIGPSWGPLTRDGYSDLGFLAGTLVYELTGGELIPHGTELRQGELYPVTEWDVVPRSSILEEDSERQSQDPTIVELYDFLWRGPEFAHLIDPISSVSAFVTRLNFEIKRINDDSIVVWKPYELDTFWSDAEFSPKKTAALLIEKNNTHIENFRPLLVTWLNHTERGRRSGLEMGFFF